VKIFTFNEYGIRKGIDIFERLLNELRMNRQFISTIVKKMKLIGIIFLIITSFSCEKNDCDCFQKTDPKDERYPINYNFVNTTDSELRALNFEVRTFFPIEYVTNFSYEHFPDVFPYDTITKTVDTTGGIGHFGYIGCATQMEVNVYYDINDTLTYVSTWWTKTDTIRSKADAEIYFFWPNDTLYCEKVMGYTYTRRNKLAMIIKDKMDYNTPGH
jgi:hypothetical protein